MDKKSTKLMKKMPFMLVLQAPNGTEIHKMEIQRLPPFDDDPDLAEERGELIAEFVTDGILDYFAFLLKVKKKCKCFAKKKHWLDGTKHYHSSECPMMLG